jgi:hypothetical protein
VWVHLVAFALLPLLTLASLEKCDNRRFIEVFMIVGGSCFSIQKEFLLSRMPGTTAISKMLLSRSRAVAALVEFL